MSAKHILAGLALVAGLSLAGAASAAANGQQVFTESCAACHQATGLGRPPTFPALKGDKFVTGPKAPVLATVLNGRGGMPAWKSELTDEEIAAVATYIRSSWGNAAPAVTTAEVTAARNSTNAKAQAKGLQAH